MSRSTDRKEQEMDEGSAIVHRVAKQWLSENEMVPLVLLALELAEPVELVEGYLGAEVVLDDVGMRCVRAETARRLLSERAEQTARIQEQARRRQEAHEPVVVGRGVPAISEDASAFASLMASEGSHIGPAEEFGGRPAPRFLEEALEAGRRKQLEEQAANRDRKGKDR